MGWARNVAHIGYLRNRYTFFTSKPEIGEPGSSVSIVFVYGLDDRAIEVRFPAEAKGFFL
jgi:hypothetical protein